ncbi:hypothetical protein HPB49_014501 [Dermacentor silvarum]|uniref:Uncharacterized protein n=1 Tax=Dermacentor silvarum TaxID=543639 RepID=A0ACB8DDU4_DERSI|nr:hypothetical protein HPB49_014501 [Dermacentor silvarum]
MAAFAAAVELAFSDQSSSSSSSSSSDGSDYEVTQALYEAFYREAFSEPPRKCPRIVGFVQDVVWQYSDEEFRRNFRVLRAVADNLISRFENSDFYPRSDRGGSPSKTAEEHVLVFIWCAANKACLRDVASRFGIGEATAFRIVERMLEYLVEIAKQIITFPADLDQLSEDFEQVSGVPNTIGCIDGSYKFLDVTVGSPSKIHDSRIFRKSRLAERLPGICCLGKFHVLGDAAYPLRDYLIAPFRDYGHLNSSQRPFNIKFSATRVKIENAFGDLKGRLRQLLHLDFFFVEKMNKFIISCCVLHNLCISSGDVDVPPYSDDVSTAWNWQAPPDDDSHNCGPLTSSEAALRRQGEEKRGRLIQAMLERPLPT